MKKNTLILNRAGLKVAAILLLVFVAGLGMYAHHHSGLQRNIRYMFHSIREDIADWGASGQTINCLGDSITEGYKNDEISWADRLPHLTGAKVNKYGVGGSTISAYVDEHPMCRRYVDMSAEADCVIIFAGNNDFTRSVPLGDNESFDERTFYGALNVLLSGLRDKYPEAEFLFVTPLKMWHYTHPKWNMPVEYDNCNKQGLTLNDYRQAIVERCGYYGIPVLDIYTQGLYGGTDKAREAVYIDGLHPNDRGHRILANQIARVIRD